MPRYSRRVRTAVILLALAACGGHPTAPRSQPAKTPPHVGSASGSATAPDPVLADIGCLQTSCAFHAGAGAYFTCLAGGAGACFHFGGPCAPPDGCMYDPSDRTYKTCTKAVEGTCAAWGATCAPKATCVFDPKDGLYHRCDDPAAGACKKYGELCAP
jgi:hypothetical protein